MRRIVQIAPSRVPGRAANSFQAIKMAAAMQEGGGNVTLIACRSDEEGPAPDDSTAMKAFYGVDSLPDIRLLPSRGRFGIHLFNLRAAVMARRIRPRLVLSRSIGAAALTARLGLPTVWECHGPPQGGERRYWSLLAGARGFRRLVLISDALKRIMTDTFPEARTTDALVAPDGVDLKRFAGLPDAVTAKKAAGLPVERPVAAYAGHLYEGRGIGLILDCAAALPHWSFIVAGGTPADIAALKRTVADRGLANVELAGFIENGVLPQRLAVADVLLMPYQKAVMVSGGRLDTAQWMSPMKMFEYMAMGRAIVSSDLPVLREVLNDANAIIVEPGKADDWISALRRLEDPGLRTRLGEAARAAVGPYDWTRRAERMLAGL